MFTGDKMGPLDEHMPLTDSHCFLSVDHIYPLTHVTFTLTQDPVG